MIRLKPRWCAGVFACQLFARDKTTDGLVLSQCVNAASYHLACDGYHQNSLCNLRLFPPRLIARQQFVVVLQNRHRQMQTKGALSGEADVA
jgi:hypothetical protein